MAGHFFPTIPGLGLDDADILSALGMAAQKRPVSAEHVADLSTDPFTDLPQRRIPPGREGRQCQGGGDETLIEALHREFDRVVADPSRLLGSADWPAQSRPQQDPAPEFEMLATLASPYVHLRDLVMPPLSIDGCIAGLDAGTPATLAAPAGWWAPSVLPEVLRLFAPEAPATGAPSALPVETRRDHHLLTTGTAMRPGRFETPPSIPLVGEPS